MAAAWPGSSVALVASGLNHAALAALQADAQAISQAPNFWIPREQLEAGPAAARTPVEAVIEHLYWRHMHARLPAGQGSWRGAEYWVQAYVPGQGLAFHFDKDEHMLVSSQRMVHPLLSSVLYLTGSTADRREGPTVVLDQQFDGATQQPVPENPSRCALVYPQRGNYCIFDGRLGHGVLDSFSSAARVTLLVNWWASQPQAVGALQAADIAKYGMSSMAPTANGHPGASQDGGVPSCSTPNGEAPSSTSSSRSDAVTIPCLVLTPEQQIDALLVDDLLAHHHLALVGEGAISAVAIDHGTLHLHPIDAQAAQQGLQTAAAFVPASMLGSSSSDSGSADEDDL